MPGEAAWECNSARRGVGFIILTLLFDHRQYFHSNSIGKLGIQARSG